MMMEVTLMLPMVGMVEMKRMEVWITVVVPTHSNTLVEDGRH